MSAQLSHDGLTDLDDALERFLEWVSSRGIELYPAQEEAILELFAGQHVLLKTPTGSGKSLVALALHFRELVAGHASVYTAPIKALVSEKFLALAEVFGPENVGMMTGDGAVNRDAPIICCTAEILAKVALRHGDETPYRAVIMDEFHFYGDRDRGMAWQVPLLTMTHARFLLMSATLGDTRQIEADLEERTSVSVAVVSSNDRPVPLDFTYSMTPVDSKLHELATAGQAPVYAVHFSQRSAAETAQALMSTNFCTKPEKKEIREAMRGHRFDTPYGSTLRRYLEHGIGLHHAGLLPKYRLLVEKLAQEGRFKVICGTDTLGVGINVPIRTVFFTQLCKFDGEGVDILTVRDFKQISGRAGRRGFDTQGYVVAQAPSWVIENARLTASHAASTKKKKLVRKKAPTKGYKHWDETTFERLNERPPEELESRFRVDHSLVLLLLQKASETLGDAMEELHALIDASHASGRAKEALHTEADAKLSELIEAGVVVDAGEEALPRYVVDSELQADFSMHHSLSLFLLHILSRLDMASPEYAMDVITMVESILEHPKSILRAQVNREKGELIARLKADGVPYEERMEALEDVTWPKPRAEWIYEVFNTYKDERPWLAEDPIRPKAIVREIVHNQLSFSNYVKQLGLERGEGVLLRYISQVYKTLLQNVPEEMRTPELIDVLAFLRALLARVDDSLVSAWQSLKEDSIDPSVAPRPIDISEDMRSFRARIRAELHAVVRALSLQDFEEAASTVRQSEAHPFSAADFETAIKPYVDERGPVRFDGRLKQGWTTTVEQADPLLWHVRQVLVDELGEDEDDDYGSAWSIEGRVDLRGNTNPSGPIVEILEIRD